MKPKEPQRDLDLWASPYVIKSVKVRSVRFAFYLACVALVLSIFSLLFNLIMVR